MDSLKYEISDQDVFKNTKIGIKKSVIELTKNFTEFEFEDVNKMYATKGEYIINFVSIDSIINSINDIIDTQMVDENLPKDVIILMDILEYFCNLMMIHDNIKSYVQHPTFNEDALEIYIKISSLANSNSSNVLAHDYNHFLKMNFPNKHDNLIRFTDTFNTLFAHYFIEIDSYNSTLLNVYYPNFDKTNYFYLLVFEKLVTRFGINLKM